MEKVKNKTCEKRIDEALKERLEEVKEILNSEDPIEALNEWALSWDGANLVLSYGGPADGFIFTVNNQGEVVHIVYYYKDWFDGAERTLWGKNFELLEQLYETCLKIE